MGFQGKACPCCQTSLLPAVSVSSPPTRPCLLVSSLTTTSPSFPPLIASTHLHVSLLQLLLSAQAEIIARLVVTHLKIFMTDHCLPFRTLLCV